MVLMPILQTVQDRENPDYVERFGPFMCESSDSWLGNGYYFWDRFEGVAKWWGETHYNGKYMICRAKAELEDDDFLDLAGNTEHMESFRLMCESIEKNSRHYVTVRYVIQFMKDKNIFPYKAIRAHSIDCGDGDNLFRRFFMETKYIKSYLNLSPAFQICVVDKSCVKEYRIVFPDEYIQGV